MSVVNLEEKSSTLSDRRGHVGVGALLDSNAYGRLLQGSENVWRSGITG